jgi:two-component system phosphate regulon sensor histidine kinase PhoR
MNPEYDDSFIAEVSHELRLPLANIKLLVETLLDGAVEDPHTAKHMLGRVNQEVERLQNLVSDLLSHEKLNGPRFEARHEAVNIFDRAQYAVECTREMAAARGVKIIVDVPVDFVLIADLDQLNQVLVNLVENAVKFTPADGTVTICAGITSGAKPLISVEDTGIGMAASEIPKIFQRFYRVDRSKTRGSTGLGLSIVKHIADLHGAKIFVESVESKGSKFTLEFPGRNLT